MVAVQDARLAATLGAAFERDLARSRVFDLDSWRDRPLWHRGLEWFWGLFGELF